MEREINQLLRNAESEDEEEPMKLKDKLWMEPKKLCIVAGPAICTRSSTFGINVITQVFVGHVGAIELAAYNLAFTVLLRFANGISLGMASGLQTLCGKAFGAKQDHMLGISSKIMDSFVYWVSVSSSYIYLHHTNFEGIRAG